MRGLLHSLAPFLLLAPVLAGCLVTPSVVCTPIEADIDDVQAYLVQDHDHLDGALHPARAVNLEAVGYHNGVDDSGDPDAIPPAGYYTELAVTSRHAYLGRASADGAFGGLSILDVRDPRGPTLVGTHEGLGVADVQVTDDEAWVFVASQRNSVEELAGRLQMSEDTGAPRGIEIVDVRHKAEPVRAGFAPLPVNGPHTMTYHRHADGGEYLFVSTYDLITDPATGAIAGAVPATQRVIIYEFHRGDGVLPGFVAPALAPVAQWQILESPPPGMLYFPHDAIPQVHPDGRTYLYVAYWDKGLQILDVTDPLRPMHVSGHTDFSPSGLNNVHQARPFDHPIAGRHVTVTEPEVISADETGHIHFFDTTDPALPVKLGHWTLPADLVVQMLDFSPHNFNTWDSKVVLAHNHAGLWVIDVCGEEHLQQPRSAGHYLPDLHRAESPMPQPYLWGAFVSQRTDGPYIFAVDQPTGLHVLRYTGP